MLKKLLTKSLLIAAGLLGGMNAWADAGDVTTLFSIDFSNGLVATGTNYATDVPNYTVAGATGTMAVHGSRISGSAYNPSITDGRLMIVGEATAPITPNAGSKDIITFEFDIANGNLTGSRTIYFNIYDNSATPAVLGNLSYNHYSSGTISGNLGFELSDLNTAGNANANFATHNHFNISYNYETGKCTAKVTKYTNTTIEGATATHVTDFDVTKQISKFVVGSSFTARQPLFDNLVITKTEGDYSTNKTITLAFKDDSDNDISALYDGLKEFTPEKGTTFNPANYYPSVMYDGDYKYTYTSGGSSFTVTEDATVTLIYTKSDRPTVRVTAVRNYGGKTASEYVDVLEGQSCTYYYPRFILDGTTLYEYNSSTDANASTSYWTSTIASVTSNISYDLTYTALEGECVYYSEGENITGATAWRYGDYVAYMSGGGSGAITEATTLCNLSAGIYKITGRAIGRASDRYLDVYKTSATDENKLLRVTSQNRGGEGTSDAFTLTESTDIVALGGYAGGSSGHACDYIYIMKIGGPITLNGSYYSTFSNAQSVQITGATAYVAEVNGEELVLTKVNDDNIVPAGTGVILKGENGVDVSYEVTDASATVPANDLKPVLATIARPNDNIYVLFGNEFMRYIGANLVAGKAYLDLTGYTSKLRMTFADDDATAINSVESEKADNGAIYNLAGQRVGKDYKGIVIKNGKKFMNK